jgi:hypothetical protein
MTKILLQANLDLIICSESNDDFCVGASRAKAAAFVYLIGLKDEIQTLQLGKKCL